MGRHALPRKQTRSTQAKGFLGHPRWNPACFPDCTHMRAFGRTGGGKCAVDSHIEKLMLLPYPLALRAPRRASKALAVAGHPILWEGGHDVCPADSSGVKRLCKPSKKGPGEFSTISKPNKGKGSCARGCSSSRGVRKRPAGQPC